MTAKNRDLKKLKGFALYMFSDFPEGMPDQFSMQDKALELGLLKKVKVKKPCGMTCGCRVYYSAREWADGGVICHRRTDLLKA